MITAFLLMLDHRLLLLIRRDLNIMSGSGVPTRHHISSFIPSATPSAQPPTPVTPLGFSTSGSSWPTPADYAPPRRRQTNEPDKPYTVLGAWRKRLRAGFESSSLTTPVTLAPVPAIRVMSYSDAALLCLIPTAGVAKIISIPTVKKPHGRRDIVLTWFCCILINSTS